jgi:hypothetical protein
MKTSTYYAIVTPIVLILLGAIMFAVMQAQVADGSAFPGQQAKLQTATTTILGPGTVTLFEASDLSEEIEFANWFGMQGAIYLNDKNKPCLNLAHSVDIEPLKLKDRAIIAWKILTNKNFKFDKVSMDWD